MSDSARAPEVITFYLYNVNSKIVLPVHNGSSKAVAAGSMIVVIDDVVYLPDPVKTASKRNPSGTVKSTHVRTNMDHEFVKLNPDIFSRLSVNVGLR
jgi:hypothetical protein